MSRMHFWDIEKPCKNISIIGSIVEYSLYVFLKEGKDTEQAHPCSSLAGEINQVGIENDTVIYPNMMSCSHECNPFI